MNVWILVAVGAALFILSRSSGMPASSYIFADKIGKVGDCSALIAYRPIYIGAAEANGLDWKWLAAQGCIESGLKADAISHAGAAGIAQLMPVTAREEGLIVAPGVEYRGRMFPVTLDPVEDERFNVALAIPVQAAMIARYKQRYGDMAHAFAAYRSGVGAVRRRGISEGDRTYIARITSRYASIR